MQLFKYTRNSFRVHLQDNRKNTNGKSKHRNISNSRSTSVDSLGQVISAKHIKLPYLQGKAIENNP